MEYPYSLEHQSQLAAILKHLTEDIYYPESHSLHIAPISLDYRLYVEYID